MKGPTCIAEVGCNHRGDLDTALRMIRIIGAFCTEHFQAGDYLPRPYVKFQKRTCDLALYPHWAAPHPVDWHAYGDTYLAHRRALEFDVADHERLKLECEDHDVGYACSVWDIPAANDIISLAPDWIKVPSARNTDLDLLSQVIDTYNGDLHISVGMTYRVEVYGLVEFLSVADAAHRTVLYACTSDYPVATEDVCLAELDWLRDTFGGTVKAIGFSGHHHGIAIDAVAAAKGAAYIERHFTLDRTWRGTDHAASLEPDGFRRLLRDVVAVTDALGSKGRDGLLECEAGQRAKLKGEAVT